MEENLINLDKLQTKMNISFRDDDRLYFDKLIPGSVQSVDITFTVDDFESATTIDFIYNEDEIISKTKEHNEMILSNEMEPLTSQQIIIAEDVGGSPIILDTISGQVYLFWFDFDGELALLFDSLELFYNALIID